VASSDSNWTDWSVHPSSSFRPFHSTTCKLWRGVSFVLVIRRISWGAPPWARRNHPDNPVPEAAFFLLPRRTATRLQPAKPAMKSAISVQRKVFAASSPLPVSRLRGMLVGRLLSAVDVGPDPSWAHALGPPPSSNAAAQHKRTRTMRARYALVGFRPRRPNAFIRCFRGLVVPAIR